MHRYNIQLVWSDIKRLKRKTAGASHIDDEFNCFIVDWVGWGGKERGGGKHFPGHEQVTNTTKLYGHVENGRENERVQP